MKRIALTITITLVHIGVMMADSSLRWGVTGGVNFSSEGGVYHDFTPGIQLGGLGEFHFAKYGFLSGSLLLSQKGYKASEEFESVNIFTGELSTTKVNIKKRNYYLELPIHIGFKINMGRSVTLLTSAGPYIAVGLWGKINDKYNNISETLYKREANDKRLDYGIGAKIKLQIVQHYQIGLATDVGLLKDSDKAYSPLNENIAASFAYLF